MTAIDPATHIDPSLDTDVLVIGGSLAGAWAALSAAQAGARVVLAEKGWVGTAGVVAAATSGGYYLLPDDEAQRRKMISFRHADADDLDDPTFIEGVYDDSYRAFMKMEEWGFRWPRPGRFRGPDSMAFLRRQLKAHRVTVLDHSPALELLRDQDGAIAGANGIHRRTGQAWQVRAGAVILATGGTAFRSGAMGTHGLTGDGYLMAAEAGAGFTGMEYSGHYALAPINSSCTKGGMYFLGKITDAQGRQLGQRPSWGAVPFVAAEILQGGKAFAQLDLSPEPDWDQHRIGAPNFYQYFSRQGLNPFTERWEVELIYEGTVRATGGIPVDDHCETEIPRLYAVGDVTDRTRLTGGQLSGAGAAVAWCVASGARAGKHAAQTAREAAKPRDVEALGIKGLRLGKSTGNAADRSGSTTRHSDILAAVQTEMLSLEKNFVRNGITLGQSLEKLAELWTTPIVQDNPTDPRERLKTREAVAMLATARFVLAAALARKETRGMHRRSDFPEIDPSQRHALHISQLDSPKITVRAPLPVPVS